MEKHRRRHLGLLSTSHGMNHVYQLLIPVIIPKITAEYFLSNFMAGVLLSCFNMSYSLLQFPFGYLSRAVGRKNLLLLGFIITSISFLTIPFVNSIILFAILFFLAGVGGSTYHPNGMPFISEFYEENRGQAAGFHQMGGALGSFISPLLIGLLVLAMDWRLTAATLSVLGIILSIILWLLLTEPKRRIDEKEDNSQSVKPQFDFKSYSSAFLLILASMVYVLGLRGIDSFSNQYFTYGRGIQNIAQASFLFSMLKVAGLFSGPFSGKLSDKFGRRKVLIILILVGSASLFALIIVPFSILIIPCIIFGFSSFGMLAITDAFLADLTLNEHRETVFGLYFTMSFMTAAIIPPILGGIIDLYGFDTGFMILSISVLFGIPILLQVKNKRNELSR